MRKAPALIVVLLTLAVAGVAQGAEEGGRDGSDKPNDRAWVKEKAQTCVSCHGEKGVSQTPNFPTIAGQYKDYLLHSLKAYRDGGRKNAVMSGQVKGMSNAQLEALAAYYARQDSPLHTPSLSE